MKTQLLYLDNSYLKEMDAQILDVLPDGDRKYKLILDKTVFYAMGGGQPTDQGTLSSPSWNGEVYQAMIKDGEHWHFVNSSTTPTAGDTVRGVIKWDRRYKNMRSHTAGHIVDFAVYLLGYSPNKLTPVKADHGKKPFIEYQGVLEENIQEQLQEKVNELVSKNLKLSWEFQPLEELKKEAIYLLPNLPTNKPLRIVRLESIGAVADGGTQLHSTSEAGKVHIDSIVTEENATLINYSIS